MALWYALNSSPLDVLLYGDRSAPSQARCSVSQPVQPHKRTWSAAGQVDVIENKAAYEFIADAPGFDPSDINVELKDKVLTISGKQVKEVKHQDKEQQQKQQQQQKQPEQQQQEGKQQQEQQPEQHQVQQASPEPEVKVWRSERRVRQFSRSFELPDDANTEDISASLDKGVLTVRVAKLPPAPKPVLRHIAVHSPAVRAC